MKKRTSKAEIVLTMGLVGMVSALITIISDFILIGKPSTAYLFLKMGTESMADLAQWRIAVGAFIGVIVLPFQILGLIPVYYGLKSSGKVLPLIVVITTAHTLIMGVAFHISYAFIGSGWRQFYEMDSGNKITSELVKRFDFYWRILVIIMLIEILFSSIIYAVIIAKGKTLYSKWMAILNPICLLTILFPFIFLLPAPVGGFIAPAYLNISTIVFYGFSTAVIYSRLKRQENILL